MQIAKEHGGIMRFVQVSCLGASSSSPSRMLRAKAAAEEAVLRQFPEVTIILCLQLVLIVNRNVWSYKHEVSDATLNGLLCIVYLWSSCFSLVCYGLLPVVGTLLCLIMPKKLNLRFWLWTRIDWVWILCALSVYTWLCVQIIWPNIRN